MGLFSRKENRVYSLQEAIKMLNMKKYEGYTTIPTGEGYFKLVPEELASKHISQYKNKTKIGETHKNKRNIFVEEVSESGIYRNINSGTNYNNNQLTRGNRGQTNYISGR